MLHRLHTLVPLDARCRPVSGGQFQILYDPDAVAADYPNLEREWETVDISLFLDAGLASQAHQLHLQGLRLFLL